MKAADELTFVLIGHPVGHSLSPVLHRAAYRALGLPHRYELVDCPNEPSVRRQLDLLRSGEIAGANVTVPHKRVALALADRVDSTASLVGAANVLVRAGDGLVHAHNTDAPALAAVLKPEMTAPRGVLVIGNGGAALAAVAAASMLGAQRVFVSGRRWIEKTNKSEWPGSAQFEKLGAVLCPWPEFGEGDNYGRGETPFGAAARESQLIIQATSAGMLGADSGETVAELLPWKELDEGTFAYDLVYNPPVTPFIRAARASGLRAENGIDMLVGQAGGALRLWLGVAPPLAEMRAALETKLRASA